MKGLRIGKIWKKGLLFSFFCMFLTAFSLHVEAAETNQKTTIYALSGSYLNYISIPDDQPQSYQIRGGMAYRVVTGRSAQVSENGLVTPKYTYRKGNQEVAEGEDYDTRTFVSEDTTIEVKTASGTYTLIVTVEDYAITYGEKIMDDYLAENINNTMTDWEIIDAIARFPASYDYGTHPSFYTMIICGKGDCSASTAAIIRLCEKLKIQAWVRNGSKDPGAGSTHINAMVELNGNYYEVDAAYNEPKGPDGYRYYSMKQRDSLFSYSSIIKFN